MSADDSRGLGLRWSATENRTWFPAERHMENIFNNDTRWYCFGMSLSTVVRPFVES